MAKTTNKTSFDMKVLVKEHLQSLKPHPTYKDRFVIVNLSVESYQDLLFKIRGNVKCEHHGLRAYRLSQ